MDISKPSVGKSTSTSTTLLVLAASLFILLLYETQDLIRFHYALFLNGNFTVDFHLFYNTAIRFLANAGDLYELDASRVLMGFSYPPLSIALFVCFGLLRESLALIAFLLTSALALLIAIRLTIAIRQMIYKDEPVSRVKNALFALLVATSGPAFSNFMAGQVNSIVMAMCLAAVFLGLRRCAGVGGGLLAFAGWIKIYPGILLLPMLGMKPLRTTAFWAMLAAALLPVVSLLFVPWELYEVYFLDLLPTMAGRIASHLNNQSVTASLIRLAELPVDSWTRFMIINVPAWIRVVNGTVFLVLAALGALAVYSPRGKSDPLLVVLLVLAGVPLWAPLGWGHAYLFAVFLVAYCAVYATSAEVRVVAACAWILLLFPAYWEARAIRDIAPVVAHILYFRYPIAVGAMIAVSIVWILRSQRVAQSGTR